MLIIRKLPKKAKRSTRDPRATCNPLVSRVSEPWFNFYLHHSKS